MDSHRLYQPPLRLGLEADPPNEAPRTDATCPLPPATCHLPPATCHLPPTRRRGSISYSWASESLRQSLGVASATAATCDLVLDYVDRWHVPRKLVLTMPSEVAATWGTGLTAILGAVQWPLAPFAYWPWVLSCMEAAGWRDGFVGSGEAPFRTLLNRANLTLGADALLQGRAAVI